MLLRGQSHGAAHLLQVVVRVELLHVLLHLLVLHLLCMQCHRSLVVLKVMW